MVILLSVTRHSSFKLYALSMPLPYIMYMAFIYEYFGQSCCGTQKLVSHCPANSALKPLNLAAREDRVSSRRRHHYV
jgi:hypothetical protein